MMFSRIFAVLILVGATLWIGSGMLGFGGAHTGPSATEAQAAVTTPFRVAVIDVKPELHARKITLSGRTEADNRASALARAPGSILDLKVQRGDAVKEGDVIAVLSDEAREAQVAQADSMLKMRQIDLATKEGLIKRGIVAANDINLLTAELAGAQAALAMARAELDRGQVRAPISGIVSKVPVTTGQAMAVNDPVAEIVALDPMLAVIEVAERQLGGVHVGERAAVQLASGARAEGAIRFISPTASEGTRTYRVEIELDNKDGAIPDGITCQVALQLQAVEAVRIPRSALTFSAEGQLSVRVVGADGMVASVAVTVVEDSRDQIWIAGPIADARVIVQGQDFVKEGQRVEAVAAAAPAPVAQSS